MHKKPFCRISYFFIDTIFKFVIDQNFRPSFVESRVIACWLFILVFIQLICWAFQGPLVSPSVQQVYLYLLCCLFWSSFSSFAELSKDHWSVQVYNKCICIFSAREHRFLPHWRLVRILSYHNGPGDINRTTHFYSPNWCTEGHIPDVTLFPKGGPVINGFRCPLSLL